MWGLPCQQGSHDNTSNEVDEERSKRKGGEMDPKGDERRRDDEIDGGRDHSAVIDCNNSSFRWFYVSEGHIKVRLKR